MSKRTASFGSLAESLGLRAELKDRLAENLYTTLEFVYRNKLSRTMRNANVAWAKHDRLGPKLSKLGSFRPEGYGAGRNAAQILQESDEA